MGFFKAYDMRGTFGVDFDLDLVRKIGFTLPQVVGGKRWLVGRDGRTTSSAVRDALVAGLVAAGAEVTDLGLATTPMVYFFTAEEDFDGSVMITASHNPPTDNGLKVSKRGALPVGYESGLAEVERRVQVLGVLPAAPSAASPIAAQGAAGMTPSAAGMTPSAAGMTPSAAGVTPAPTDPVRLARYVAWLKAHAPVACDSLKFAVDCSDGMASILAHELFPHAVFLNDKVDGAFPHHSPNPLLAESRAQLAGVVRAQHLDCGVIFDGDADRCMFVDETGEFIQPDFLIPTLASTYLDGLAKASRYDKGVEPRSFEARRYDKGVEPRSFEARRSDKGVKPYIIHDVRTSRAAIERLREMGCEPVIGKVGHAYAKVLLRKIDAVCGGELAGHYYIRDFHGCDSGELAALRMLGAFAEAKAQGQTVSAYLAPVTRKYANSGEVNFKVADKPAAIARVLAAARAFGPEIGRCSIDGERIEFAEGWISIRLSNTEPYLRLLAECDTRERLDSWLQILTQAIQQG